MFGQGFRIGTTCGFCESGIFSGTGRRRVDVSCTTLASWAMLFFTGIVPKNACSTPGPGFWLKCVLASTCTYQDRGETDVVVVQGRTLCSNRCVKLSGKLQVNARLQRQIRPYGQVDQPATQSDSAFLLQLFPRLMGLSCVWSCRSIKRRPRSSLPRRCAVA